MAPAAPLAPEAPRASGRTRLAAVVLLCLCGWFASCAEVKPWRERPAPWDAATFEDAAQVRVTLHDGRALRLERPRLEESGTTARLSGKTRDAEDRWVDTTVELEDVARLETRPIGPATGLLSGTVGTLLLIVALAFGAAWVLTGGEFRFGGRF